MNQKMENNESKFFFYEDPQAVINKYNKSDLLHV